MLSERIVGLFMLGLNVGLFIIGFESYELSLIWSYLKISICTFFIQRKNSSAKFYDYGNETIIL